MSRFYGEIQGNRGEATRQGSPDSGFYGHIRGWNCGAKVQMTARGEKDVCCVYATGGSNGSRSSTYLATITDDPYRIEINHRLDKYVSEDVFVDLKELISATIFDYDCAEGTNYNRPDEEDCNALAEQILEKLGYKPFEV
jgi:hypothetical protein